MEWLLFLSQLPISPSSLRVNVWRKLRAAGALGLQNGVWVLPKSAEQVAFLEDLLKNIQSQGASGHIFSLAPLNGATEEEIIERFRADRDEEYTEFIERAQELLAEIEKETARQKFTFAELEENEQSLQRLETWLEKIRKRDFVSAGKSLDAVTNLEKCRAAFEAFSTEVFKRSSASQLE